VKCKKKEYEFLIHQPSSQHFAVLTQLLICIVIFVCRKKSEIFSFHQKHPQQQQQKTANQQQHTEKL
jgi:hypothetical protein